MKDFLIGLKKFIIGLIVGMAGLILIFVIFYYGNELFSSFNIDIMGPLSIVFGLLFISVIAIVIYKRLKENSKFNKNELEKQISEYHNIKVIESYRGISALIFLVSLILSTILTFLSNGSIEIIIFSLIIYLPLIYFVYKGQRWAMLSLMLLYTLDKFYQIANNEVNIKVAIIFWIIIMPILGKAFIIETERIKINKKENNKTAKPEEQVIEKIKTAYCSKCGSELKNNSIYCHNCGQKI